MSLYNFQRILVYCFIFFGPLGSLLSPPFMPYAFRFYHFLLVLSPLFLLQLKRDEWKVILTFIPFLAYCFVSAYFTENKPVQYDAHPFFRGGLFVAQYLFMFGAVFHLRREGSSDMKRRILRFYLTSYFLSLIVGYILFFGYYSGWLSFETVDRFCVQAQMGWGILRFSPGSYPNEYGNVSSFVLSVLILLLAGKKKFTLFLYFFIALTFVALILATTRAAYFSFILTFFYLCFVSKEVRRIALKFACAGVVVIALMKYYSFDFLFVFVEGIKKISTKTGSSGTRITEWVNGFDQLGGSSLLGTGFGSIISTHNVYLELLYEIGIIGVIIFFISLLYYFSENHKQLRKTFLKRLMDPKEVLYNQIMMIGLVHVFLFAITNHNMHHHLTWVTFLFFNMSLFSREEELAAVPSAPGGKHKFALRFLR